MRWRNALVALSVAVIAATSTSFATFNRLDGLSIDALFWLRHHVYGPQHGPEESPTVVIAIDEETYRRQPFSGLPKTMWTPQLAQVLNAVVAGGAAVVGQDIILPTSVEKYIRGFDRDYLVALNKAARDGRIVLGKVQHSKKPISPFPGYSFAVGNQRNIRLVNLFRDDDGIIRRVPLRFSSIGTDGGKRTEASMALELAARTADVPLNLQVEGSLLFGDYDVPGAAGNAMPLNFDTGGRSLPVYSFADLVACAAAGQSEFFTKNFQGKAVLIGTALDVEDRKLTSQRYVTGPEGAWMAARCVEPVMTGLYNDQVKRDSIPGVFVLATAVNNLLRHDALRILPAPFQNTLALLVALFAAVHVMLLRPWLAGIVLVTTATLWVVITTVIFSEGLVIPLFDPLVAMAFTFIALVGYRFGIADREKRQIRQAFAYYLSPTVIDRMVASNQAPKLGGETRDLTVWFSDLAGFTRLSEGLTPGQVVSFMNGYLSAITDIIESHGGFVDKYIGDAVVAVFGAPMEDPEHAKHGVAAALACQRRLATLIPELGYAGSKPIVTRIGINSGKMLIGNIGSKRRFNYTVMGDAVNLASRLEGANKNYGTTILISGDTAQRIGDQFVLRAIDRVQVVGREEPVDIYEAIDPEDAQTTATRANLERFAAAYADYQAGNFVEAAEGFESIAENDPVATCLAKRARDLSSQPLPAGWNGVHRLDQK